MFFILFFIDQIAVPDFAAGAMENWGLVIYRETALLFDPKINSPSNQQRVAVVVAHELAHQVQSNYHHPGFFIVALYFKHGVNLDIGLNKFSKLCILSCSLAYFR